MKSICLINGSPKIKGAASLGYLNELSDFFDEKEFSKHFINVKESTNSNRENDYGNMANADAVIIAFPLYFYCLPGVLMRFLEEYSVYAKNKGLYKKDTRLYVIVNCGFPEPHINEESIRVIKNFCKRLNINWRFAISIGCGSFIAETKEVPVLKRNSETVKNALKEIALDIQSNAISKKEDIRIEPKFAKFFMGLLGDKIWTDPAKKNGLSKKDLYKRPYVG